jgi:hypothetical protein
MDSEQGIRKHVVSLLRGRGAHMDFDAAVADFPLGHINTYPPNMLYTFWHLLEHLRITQWDILEYVRDPKHASPPWPEGYWPDPDAQADEAAWHETVRQFHSDLQAMIDIVNDPKTDLLTPIPHGYDGHTILREALILADHNSYHVGELGILRQIVDAWPDH